MLNHDLCRDAIYCVSPLWQQLHAFPLPHALLFYGLAGLGKTDFARAMAASLLCEAPEPQGSACGKCPACQLFISGNHPDFQVLEPEGASRSIKIDSIRELDNFARQTAYGQKARVILLKEADRLNIAAGNALLKILEEPGPKTYFFLVTEDLAKVMPTILSRCQKHFFQAPPRAQALAWLKEQGLEQAELLLTLAQGAPFRAKTLADADYLAKREKFFEDLQKVLEKTQSLSVFAESWAKDHADLCVDFLASLAEDAIKFQVSPEGVVNQDHLALIHLLARRSSSALFAWYDQILQARQKIRSPVAFNAALLLETLLISGVY